MSSVGILAYGSLIDDPGEEIESLIARRIEEDVVTPFNVEFARKSSVRDGAPTLIPVDKGGTHIRAVILVLKDSVSVRRAKDILWRRETAKIGTSRTYDPPPNPTKNTVLIEELESFLGIDKVLYTRIGSNIRCLTPRRLAELAIKSARAKAGARGRDGINYLLKAKSNGIETPFMPDYENKILKKTGTKSLEEALGALGRSRIRGARSF